MLLLPSKASSVLASRRSLLTGGGRAVLSATAVALIAGCAAKAATMQTADMSKSDVDVLNTALALEYEGIAAYQVGAESGLLQPPVLKLAVGFQSDHKQHADALAKAITKLGGMPVQSKTVAEYNFPTSTLKNQTDVLRFAAGLEEGAVNAYAGAIPLFARPAGSVPGFDYSAAMKNSGIVWSATTLDLFLQGPRQMVPGTKMTFVGLSKAQDRADLIAYLEAATKP